MNESHRVEVGGGHTLHVEVSGNPTGIPAVYLHGGPGAASDAFCHTLMDPQKYCIFVYDQRGCGKSLCAGDPLRHNTTPHMVMDLEKIRVFFRIPQWGLVMGGSWGASLALIYAIHHPDRVQSYVVRGTSLLEHPFWSASLLELYPERWDALRQLLPQHITPKEVHPWIHRAIHVDHNEEVARAFTGMEMGALGVAREARLEAPMDSKDMWDMARISSHYEANRWFLPPQYLRKQCHRIAHIPGIFIHGRLDVICPLRDVWQGLLPHLRGAQLWIVEGAGHSYLDPPIAQAMREASVALFTSSKACRPCAQQVGNSPSWRMH